MGWNVITYIVTIFISIAVMGFLAAYAWRHRKIHGAATFGILCFLGAFGAIAELLSLVSAVPETAVLWYDARFVALAGIPVLWLIFSLQYSGRPIWSTPRRVALLFIIPATTQVMIWTNGLHGLWLKSNVGFYRAGAFLIADTGQRVPGPWFMVHTLYGYFCLLLGVVLVMQMVLRLLRVYRGQALALAAGTAVLIIGSSIPTFNLVTHLKVNPITQSLAVSAFIFGWAIFHYRFLDMVPVARDILIDSMEDCMLVLDMRDRIVDINRAMLTLLAGALDAGGNAMLKKIIGRPAMEVLHPWRKLAERFRNESNMSSEIEVRISGVERHFDLRLSPLVDRSGQVTGRIMVLRDISERKQVQSRMEEALAALRASEFRYRRLFEAAKDGIIILDAESGRIVDVNPFLIDLMGFTRAEIIGKHIWELGTFKDIAANKANFLELQQKEYIRYEDLPVVTADGRTINIEFISNVYMVNDNRVIQCNIRDITERRLADNIIQARLRLIDFAVHHSLDELLRKALDEVCAITESPIGFYHFVEPDQVTLSLQAWSTRTEKEFCTAAGQGLHYSVNEAGVWAECVHLRRPVIHNDYAALPNRKGMPEGHAHVERELVVPILREGMIVAILGVGNKAQDYTDKDISVVTYFADVAWEITRRKQAEDALRLSEKTLRERNLHMEKDMKIAQAAQKGIIQGTKPICDRVAIDFRYKPMEKVGGDYFSFSQARDGSLGFFIGDVSGHGLAAALFISLLKSTSDRMFRDYWDRPSAYLENLNHEIVDYMATYYLTGIYGVFDSCGGKGDVTLRFASGGHPLPVLARSGGGMSFSGQCGNLIGVSDNVNYGLSEERLARGDRVFLYTDGICETINDRKEMIGFDEELLELFRRARRDSLPGTLDAVMEEINLFRETRPLQDDITLIGFEVM